MQQDISLNIKGMSCASCVNRVEKALSKDPGIQSVSVNLATEKAKIVFNNAVISVDKIIGLITQAGYEASFKEERKEIKLEQEKTLILISALLTLPLVLPMILVPFGYHLMPPPLLQFLLATPIQFYIGAGFYKSAYRALKVKTGNMELLVAIGTSAAYGLSLYLMLKNWEHLSHHPLPLYFESSAMVITLVLLGKYLETKAKMQTTSAIKSLQKLQPLSAQVLKNNQEIKTPIGEIKLHDLVVIRPGERIPVDGIVKEGSTQVDESLITGESLPVEKSSEDKITAGSINSDGLIYVEVTATGSETVLSRIVRLVEEAQANKAPIQRLVDKVSAYFVPVVILISFLTVILTGLILNDWEIAIIHGVAVLVIACPCALGLATPTSIMVGTGEAARAGILIKDAKALEITHSLTTIAFDKTGTLTDGKPSIQKIHVIEGSESEFMEILASIQNGSEHPLAQATIHETKKRNITIREVQFFKAIPGRGIEARVNGNDFIIGSKKVITEMGLDHPELRLAYTERQNLGETISFLIDKTNHTVLGFITYSDSIKESALQTITQLKELGIKTLMITGDNQGSAQRVAGLLGIDEYRAEVLPEQKSRIIDELKHKGELVGMVGDGINDAPALSAAHVGMAMSTGTDVAMHSAGITLMRGEPLLIPDAISISRKTYSKIKQNLFWAFIYNVIGIPLAAFGYLSPAVAGAAMALSSVSVVTNSLLLRKWKASNKNERIL